MAHKQLSRDTLRRRMHRNPIRLPANKQMEDKRRKVDVNLANKDMKYEHLRD